MKDWPIIFSAPMVRALLDGRKTMTRRHVPRWKMVQPGDRLWVRESWSLTGEFSDATSKYLRGFYSPERVLGRHLRHRADADGYDEASQAWRPSIHMPRWASRLTLTVTATKIERLQEISEEDAKAEGVSHLALTDEARARFDRMKPWPELHRPMFMLLWETLHGAGAWNANPEVVALTFTVANRNIDQGETK